MKLFDDEIESYFKTFFFRKRDRERLLLLEEKSDNIAKEFDDFEQKIEEALDDMRQKIHKKGRFAKHFKELAQNRRDEYQQQQSPTQVKNFLMSKI